MESSLKFEKKENGIGLLTLNRPQALNALNSELLSELENFLKKIPSLGLRTLVLTGAGKSFVAGADIKEMVELGGDQALSLSQRGQNIFNQIENLPLPTLAAVNGFALGGGLELALSCDFLLAQEKAKFGLPEVSLGLIPGYGGTQRLSRCIGFQKAKRMILTGEMIGAQQAYDWGLVTEVLPSSEDLMNRAFSLGKEMSKKGGFAQGVVKQCIKEGLSLSLNQSLELESAAFSQCFEHPESREGISAFIEKRPAQF